MDISTLLGALISNNQMNDVATRAQATGDETKSVLSSALGLLTDNASNGSLTADMLGSLSGSTDSGSLITTLLGAGGVGSVAQESGVSEEATNNILGAVAPMVLSSLTGASDNKRKSGLLSILTGLIGGGSLDSIGDLVVGLFGKGEEAAEDAVETVTNAAADVKEEVAAQPAQKKTGLAGLLSKLFGGK